MQVEKCERTGHWCAFYRTASGKAYVVDDVSLAVAMAGIFWLVQEGILSD